MAPPEIRTNFQRTIAILVIACVTVDGRVRFVSVISSDIKANRSLADPTGIHHWVWPLVKLLAQPDSYWPAHSSPAPPMVTQASFPAKHHPGRHSLNVVWFSAPTWLSQREWSKWSKWSRVISNIRRWQIFLGWVGQSAMARVMGWWWLWWWW